MFYLSLNDICTAFTTLRKQIDNRLIGILGILQAIDSDIEPNKTYEVQDERIARWYDKVLYFSDGIEEMSTTRTHFVKFSRQWKLFIANSFLKETPNIYHLISVVYFYCGWNNKPTHEELLLHFIKDFHIDKETVEHIFETSKLPLFFEDTSAPKRSELKSKLGLAGETFTFDIRGGSIQARPSQLSRAPFFQTLYSGIECLECLLIANKDIEALYPSTKPTLSPSQNTPLQLIYFGTPGSGKSYKVQKSLAGVSEDNVFRTTFHPDSDYASFVGCYKPTTHQGLGRKPLSKAELVAKFIQYKRTNKGYVLHRFCATHPEFGDLSRAEKEAFLVAVNEPSTNYAEILKAVACAKEVSKSMQKSDITYEFIPQVFTNAYVQAWKKQAEAIEQEKEQAEDVYLVIEEINRGNCAQIFGDLFQLLDRDKDGTSTYKIRADKDLADYLTKELGEQHPAIAGGNLRLPANLHILATMNTSDQSLFPMDSAFKRRWDWEYVPIDYSDNVDSSKFEISIGDKTDKKTYRWVDFLKAVNARILSATDSEDKQMGNFFIKHSVEEKEFKSKVMFYLWHEVCKDEYHTKNNFFRTLENQEEKEFSFNQLHEEDGTSLLEGFMQYLGVKTLDEIPSQEGDGTPNDAEENDAEE